MERRSPFLHDDELLRIDDASALPFWEEVEASYHLNSLMRPASDADVADVDRWLAAHRAQVAKRHGIVHDVMALPHGQRLQVTWMGNVKPAEVDWLQELIMGEMRSLYAKGRLLTEVTFQFENDLDMRLVYERLAVGED